MEDSRKFKLLAFVRATARQHVAQNITANPVLVDTYMFDTSACGTQTIALVN
jgi:proline racemase